MGNLGLLSMSVATAAQSPNEKQIHQQKQEQDSCIQKDQWLCCIQIYSFIRQL